LFINMWYACLESSSFFLRFEITTSYM